METIIKYQEAEEKKMEASLLFLNVRDIEKYSNRSDFFLGVAHKLYSHLLCEGYAEKRRVNLDLLERLKNHFLEKGFYVHTEKDFYLPDEGEIIVKSRIGRYEKGKYKRIEEKDLLYLVFKRFQNMKDFEKYVLTIIKSYL